MKRYLLLSIFVAGYYLANSQPYATVAEEFNHGKSSGQQSGNSSRSIPPGILLYSQPFACPPYNGLRSETDVTNSEVADDFILSSASSIDIVRWWFIIAEPPESTSWIIRIYSNENCLPSSLINTWNIPAAAVNYEIGCESWGSPVHDCWASLVPAFSAIADEHYWISIQGDGGWEFWATYGVPGQTINCSGAFKSAYFHQGNTEFFPDASELGAAGDFSFELYSAANVNNVPISDWAIGLGVFLILIVAIFRFRRIF